ncbi:forkhead box protein N3-like [Gadus chalcogrammus]|uniref:forkhead box protein N3-like n=1 Tax=Gadus chalcogrammus TaxID=1042646 RepID=UPI0024C4D99F|nr:forkhead box protein N3-like [Gadus chalcogrammus]
MWCARLFPVKPMIAGPPHYLSGALWVGFGPWADRPLSLYSPPLWSGSPLFRKNGGVLLQAPRSVIQNGARVRNQGLFPVIRPLPVSPVGSRTTTIRSVLGDYTARAEDSQSGDEDAQDDHTYSTAKSPSRSCSSSQDEGEGEASSHCSPLDEDFNDDDIIAVEIGAEEVKPEPREIPLDLHVAATAATFLTQQPLRAQRRGSGAGAGAGATAGSTAGGSLPWTKNRLRGVGDTLPLKKRRAATAAAMVAAMPVESDDEEMKEAAGSLLHLAGVRACLNNITNRTAKGQKEQKETLRN